MSSFIVVLFFFKQKTAYELRISDWSSDVGSSDLLEAADDLAAFEPEIVGIGADETDRVGRTGQFPDSAALDRLQVRIADAQHVGDIPEILTEFFPPRAEKLADRLRSARLLGQRPQPGLLPPHTGRAPCRERGVQYV